MAEISTTVIRISLTGAQWFAALAVLSDPHVVGLYRKRNLLSEAGLRQLSVAKDEIASTLAFHARVKGPQPGKASQFFNQHGFWPDAEPERAASLGFKA